MKTVCKKLFSLMLVAVLLVSAIPFQAFAATGDPVDVYFKIANEPISFAKVVGGIGYGLGVHVPSADAVNQQYVSLHSDGKVFSGKWVIENGPKAGYEFTSATVLSEDMRSATGEIIVMAIMEFPKMTVTLNANGGKVDPATVSYQMHEAVGYKLPAPTRDGYVFGGWYTNPNDETTAVTVDTVVTKNMTVYAKWNAGSLPVVFQKWDAATEKWVEVERRNPTTGKSFRDSGISLPAQNENYLNRPGYSVNEDYPWIDSNGNVFTADTVVNAVTYVRPNFKANEYTITFLYKCDQGCAHDYNGLSQHTQKVTFDSKVNLPTPTRPNHVFTGWRVFHDGKELKTGDVYKYGDIYLHAEWAPKGTVELRVYRDDTDGFKTYYYSGASLNGEVNLNNCKIENYLKGDYEFDGWYDYNGWVAYLGTKGTKGIEEASNTITRLDSIKTSTDESSVTVIYGMVKGYKATIGNNATNNNNSVNTGTADPTNPKTGDTIMIAVSTMAMAAAALVAMYELKKRKMI